MSEHEYYSDFVIKDYPGDGSNRIRLKHSQPVRWGRKQTILAWFWIILATLGGILLIVLT